MLRNDGKYEIFIIEHQYEKEGKWSRTSFDGGFKMPDRHILKNGVWEGKENEPYESFSASGQCWQETGEHGVFDTEMAIKLYLILKKNNPEHNFRVVKKTVWQDSEVLWSH